ncbi:MAG TPA: hypothetical protein PL041_15320 [Melioribacteraceae bacterium]|nr:hypothetical protein [Melioribacteraceae bacterium]
MITIGIVGTWKNTGKTTALSYIISELNKQKIRIAVTGIGYDGEEFDNITNLPKPRLLFERDSIVSTSDKCLTSADLFYKTLEKTNFNTPLGNINIVHTLSSGMIVVAGPNKKSSLQSFFNSIKKYGIDILLIDGSLNRIAPLSIADYIIFATGASRSTDINFLAEEMHAIEFLFSLPKTDKLNNCEFVVIKNDNGVFKFSFSSLFDVEDAIAVCKKLSLGCNDLIVPKIISDEALNFIVKNNPGNIKINLIVDSPISFLLSGSPIQTVNIVKDFINTENSISYINKPILPAVTVNPFYPKPIDHYYVTEYLDKNLLRNEVAKKLNTKVYDIKANPNGILEFINGLM